MSKSNKWQYLLVLFLISAILVLAAYIYYNSETKEIRKEKNETLSTINHLKLNQFIEWKTDITGQTKFFTTIGQLIKYTDWLIKNPDNKEAQNYFIKTFKPLKERRNFETIFICDKGGKLLFSLDSSFEKIDSVTAANIKSSAKGDSLVFGDFYYNNKK